MTELLSLSTSKIEFGNRVRSWPDLGRFSGIIQNAVLLEVFLLNTQNYGMMVAWICLMS